MTSYESSSEGTVNYLGWLVAVIGWDGILPICILAIPQLVLSFGADPSQAEILAIAMPLLAFFVRIPVGCRRIAQNHCGLILRCCQFVVFFFAAVFLVCIDALALVSMEMNNGWLWANRSDFFVWIGLLSIYFLAMVFVLYPGLSTEQDPLMSDTEIVDLYY